MMSKYSKFGDDTFNTVCLMGYIKILHNHDIDDDQANKNYIMCVYINLINQKYKCGNVKLYL